MSSPQIYLSYHQGQCWTCNAWSHRARIAGKPYGVWRGRRSLTPLYLSVHWIPDLGHVSSIHCLLLSHLVLHQPPLIYSSLHFLTSTVSIFILLPVEQTNAQPRCFSVSGSANHWMWSVRTCRRRPNTFWKLTTAAEVMWPPWLWEGHQVQERNGNGHLLIEVTQIWSLGWL